MENTFGRLPKFVSSSSSQKTFSSLLSLLRALQRCIAHPPTLTGNWFQQFLRRACGCLAGPDRGRIREWAISTTTFTLQLKYAHVQTHNENAQPTLWTIKVARRDLPVSSLEITLEYGRSCERPATANTRAARMQRRTLAAGPQHIHVPH